MGNASRRSAILGVVMLMEVVFLGCSITTSERGNVRRQQYTDSLKESSDKNAQTSYPTEVKEQTNQLLESKLNQFRSARRLSVDIDESDMPDGINLSFRQLATSILGCAGVEVVKSSGKKHDAILEVVAKGRALGSTYNVYQYGGRYLGKKWFWTGAAISGTISFQIPGTTSHTWSFEGRLEPRVPLMGDRAGPNIQDAPFDRAFVASDSYLECLIEMVGQVYGPNALVCVLRKGDWEGMDTKYKIRNYEVYKMAESALIAIGNPAVPLLIETLKTTNPPLRPVVYALGEIGDQRALEPLIEVLENKVYDEKLREAAAAALGKLSSEKALGLLLNAIQDESYDVREGARSGLLALRDPLVVQLLIPVLREGPDHSRGLVLATIRQIVCETDQSYPGLVPLLIHALKDADGSIRYNAAWALGHLDDWSTVDTLIDTLRDKERKVRWRAHQALVNITKIDFGDDPMGWEMWWETREKKDLGDR